MLLLFLMVDGCGFLEHSGLQCDLAADDMDFLVEIGGGRVRVEVTVEVYVGEGGVLVRKFDEGRRVVDNVRGLDAIFIG